MKIDPSKLSKSIFESSGLFFDKAKAVFHYQAEHNPVYRVFSKHFISDGQSPERIEDIPLLPIRAFKDANLITEGLDPELIFRSSGTGSMSRSKHPVADADLYRRSILHGFSHYFNIEDFTLLCYTPGYSDNSESSLLWMLKYLVDLDEHGLSKFLPLNQPLKRTKLLDSANEDRKILLFGAAFGLLDLIEMGSDPLPEGSHIIETGGMKTHRREMGKTELRQRISNGFKISLNHIHSEYGMCEMLSQLYAIGGEWFESPEWVHASVRDPNNPSRICDVGEEGKIGVIDLANLYSCSFILTEDRGVMNEEGKIAVLGRWHSAALRGCNFLIDRD